MVTAAAKIKCLVSEKEQVQVELAAEKASEAALEVQLQETSSELQTEVSGLQEEVARARKFVEEKERELEELQELRLKNVSCNEELRDLQETVSRLKRELLDRGRELAQSRESASGAEKELASMRTLVQEKSKSEESWKEQMFQCLQEGERKTSFIRSLEQEISVMHQQLVEKKAESKDLRQLVLAESEKGQKLEEKLRLLQSKMATAVSLAAERCSAMKAEVLNDQELATETVSKACWEVRPQNVSKELCVEVSVLCVEVSVLCPPQLERSWKSKSWSWRRSG